MRPRVETRGKMDRYIVGYIDTASGRPIGIENRGAEQHREIIAFTMSNVMQR
jgi:hypothetical protein